MEETRQEDGKLLQTGEQAGLKVVVRNIEDGLLSILGDSSPPARYSCTTLQFDDLLTELGEFGRYQRRLYFLLFLPTIFAAIQKQSWVFLAPQGISRYSVQSCVLRQWLGK